MLSENRWKVILLVAASVAAVESSRALSIVYEKPRSAPMFVPKHFYRRTKQSRVLFLDESENHQPLGRGEIDLTTDKYTSRIKFDDATDYEFTSPEDGAGSAKASDDAPSGNERYYEPLPRFRPPSQLYPKYYQGRFGRPYAPSYGFDPYTFAPAVRNGLYAPNSGGGWKARSPRVVFPYASDNANSVQTNSHAGPSFNDNVVFREQSFATNDIGAEEPGLQDVGTGGADAFAERGERCAIEIGT
ncbi:unnamed protein product, partial [Iphiclides podalirius]